MVGKEFLSGVIKEQEKKLKPLPLGKLKKRLADYHQEVQKRIPQYFE